ncbi:uncharacterized protein H6S33_008145 [Morchella sextelata]|uniref:uncharacterized protein n=1 Tax=Morchella sextelata TaxID=1174677 RepID=UPI001D052E79|nr:uncharacterized protein H6S33_008145 [Morchella sextelata]KAH0603141.1 hypothetical protein H6S33_008145 [Morchella sextelata]
MTLLGKLSLLAVSSGKGQRPGCGRNGIMQLVPAGPSMRDGLEGVLEGGNNSGEQKGIAKNLAWQSSRRCRQLVNTCDPPSALAYFGVLSFISYARDLNERKNTARVYPSIEKIEGGMPHIYTKERERMMQLCERETILMVAFRRPLRARGNHIPCWNVLTDPKVIHQATQSRFFLISSILWCAG